MNRTYEFYPKKFTHKKEAQNLFLQAAEEVAEVVGATMGPEGQLVMYEESLMNPYPTVTKDGVSVARMITYADQVKNMAAQFIIQACNKQLLETGDGTTLTTILIKEMFKQSLDKINTANMRINAVVDELRLLCEKVIEYIEKNKSIIDDQNKLEWIARISSNNDKELGKIVSEAVWKTGLYGLVSKQPAQTTKHSVEYKEGYTLETGYTHHSFVNTPQGVVRIEDPYLLITDQQIFYASRLNKIIKSILDNNDDRNKKPSLVIVSPTLSNELMGICTRNANDQDAMIKLYWIKPTKNLAPEKREFVMNDLAALSNGFYLSENSGYKIEGMDSSKLGRVKMISQTPTETLFSGFETEALNQRIKILKINLDKYAEELTKEYARESIARLNCGIAIIKIGGANDSEQREILDRVDDAVRACKSALEGGYSLGGGVAMLKAYKQVENDLFKTPYNYFIFSAQIRKILENAGADQQQITKIIDDIVDIDSDGYTIDSFQIADMKKLGIIDPTKVLTQAIRNALSSTISMLRTAVMIVHDYQGIKQIKEFEQL